MQQLSILLIAFFISLTLAAQVGEIQGKVKDMEMNGEGLPFANVYVEVDSIPRSTSTDMDGFYSIKPLPPGIYNVTVEYVGYTTLTKDSIVVQADKSTFVDFEMTANSEMLEVVTVINIRYPSLPKFKFKGGVVSKRGKSIGNALVTVSTNYFNREIFTEKSGSFQTSLTNGDYDITITHSDYKTYEGGINISDDTTQTFKLKKKRRRDR